MPDRALVWWHADSEVYPEAYRVPWALTGAGRSLSDGALLLQDTSAVSVLTYTRKLYDSDGMAHAPRARDWVWFQVRVKGLTATPAWASGASPIGFYVDDGARALGVSIGSTLQFIDPYTGNVIAGAATAFPWLLEHVYLLCKVGSDRWILWVDGKLTGQVSYTAGVPSAGSPAKVGFGSLDVGGLSSALWNQPEVGLNQAVPPQWKVDREFAVLPVAMQTRWTEMARAALRATIGIMETPLRLLEEAWRDLTAARLAQTTYAFTGERLPSLDVPAWTLLNAPDVSIERERVRLDALGVLLTGVRATLTTPATGLPNDVEYALRATWTVREYTPDAQGRVGPYMQAINGHGRATAQLVEVGTGQWAWVLTNDQLVGAYTVIGTEKWRVDITQPHEVELQVLGRDWVLLLVNKRIVDRIPYSKLTSGASPFMFELASSGGGAGPQGVYLVENVTGERRLCDLARRSLLLQNAVERLIFVGGCERNDELETWMQHHHEVEELRGSTQGIIVEMRRLACNEDCFVVHEDTWTAWYLEVTYPEVTPIWLETDGKLVDVFVEFGVGSLNFSPQELADLAANYLVPTSVLELQYFICLAARLTNLTFVPVPGVTRVTVVTTEGFEVGDTVTIRNPGNTVNEEHTVLNVVSGTVLDITQTAFAPFPINSVIRKTLATT